LALDGYQESEQHTHTVQEIVNNTFLKGPLFADELKKIKFKSIVKTFWGVPEEFAEWYESTISFQNWTDIGAIFSFRHLPFWKEEDPEDYKHMLKDAEAPYSKKLKKSIKEILLSNLPDKAKIPEISKEEIFLENSGSSSFDIKTRKTLPFYLNSETLKFSINSKVEYVKRCVIPISPQNYRDTIILSPDNLNYIKLLDKQTMHIAELMIGSIHLRNPKKILSKIKKFSEINNFFYSRDIEKEGLTKPRQLLKIILEVLYEKYGYEIYSNFEPFNNLKILVEDKYLETYRGHGLGMCNSITTIMNILIFLITLNDPLNLDDSLLEDSMDVLTINDDFTVGGLSMEDIENYRNLELIYLDLLGIKIKMNKTFVSKQGFVIAENYFACNGVSLNKKESLWRTNALMILYLRDIILAKQVYSSQVQSNLYLEEYKFEILSCYGYEFHSIEAILPYSWGGWENYLDSNQVDFSLVKLEFLKFEPILLELTERIYNANKCAIHLIKDWKYKKLIKNKDCQKTVYPSYFLKDLTSEEIFKLWDQEKSVIYTYDDMYTLYSNKRSRQKLFEIDLNNLRKRRYKSFSSNIHNLPFSSFIKKVINESMHDFYPISEMIQGRDYESDIHILNNSRDLYQCHNSKQYYINSVLGKEGYKNEFSILFGSFDAVWQSNPKWIRLQKEISGELFFKDIIPYDEILDKGMLISEHTFSRYIRPFSFGKTELELGGYYLPIIKDEYLNNEVLKKKTSVFGRILSVSEYLFFHNFTESFEELYDVIYNSSYTKELIEIMIENSHLLEKREEKILTNKSVQSVVYIDEQDPTLGNFDPSFLSKEQKEFLGNSIRALMNQSDLKKDFIKHGLSLNDYDYFRSVCLSKSKPIEYSLGSDFVFSLDYSVISLFKSPDKQDIEIFLTYALAHVLKQIAKESPPEKEPSSEENYEEPDWFTM